MMNFKSGALIAIAAGGLFAAACKKEDKGAAAKDQPAETEKAGVAPAEKPAPEKTVKPEGGEKTAKVDCYGVNECKGKTTCKTEKHGCGGQNECKGQGVTPLTEAECAEKGGKVINQ